MSKVTKVTKPGSLSQSFKQAAVADPKGSLAFMFMSAFGVSLDVLMALATKMAETNDVQMVVLAVTAGVQIRNHVVYVGSEYAGVRGKYPELIIDGARDQQDQFNFGALHALGHLLSHCSQHALAKKAIAKAGSCITGEMTTDSEAGKINKEIYDGWTRDEVSACSVWRGANGPMLAYLVDPVFMNMAADAKAFAAGQAPKARAVPIPATKAAASQ